MAVTINASTTSGFILNSDTSGELQLQTNGTTRANITPSGLSIVNYNPATSLITSGTAVSASGTSILFTSIPTWVKRITVCFSSVGTNGTARLLLRIGSGSVDTTGYQATAVLNGLDLTDTTGFFACWRGDSANIVNGAITLTLLGSNTWVQGGSTSANAGATTGAVYMGTKTLSGALDRISITTANGTDSYDAGSINILYE
jgi:hypothetical protein